MKEQAQQSCSSAQRNKERRSFTLIELLVVVAILGILMGISLKVTTSIFKKVGTARSAYVVEQTKSALEAYYIVMNQYPTSTVIRSSYAVKNPSWPFDPGDYKEEKGLVYFLKTLDHPQKSSWQKYIKGVDPAVIKTKDSMMMRTPKAGFDEARWTNFFETIEDGFEKEIYYRPDTNDYQSYRVFSSGPDKQPDTGDDVAGMDSLM
jgi:prepilin-type N-terminal cleavage/methylation domain-containing protein